MMLSSVTVRTEEYTSVHLGRDLLKRPLVNGQPRDHRVLFANMVKVETSRILFRTEGTAVFLAFLFGYPRDRFGSRGLRMTFSVTVRTQHLTLRDLRLKRFLSVPECDHRAYRQPFVLRVSVVKIEDSGVVLGTHCTAPSALLIIYSLS